MVNAEEELLRGAMPFCVAFVWGKLQAFERVSIRIFEVEGLNALCFGVPLGKLLGTGRSMFDLVLPQPAVRALQVTHNDGDVLEPAVMAARVCRYRFPSGGKVFGQHD